MQGREHVSGRSDQAPLAGQADHCGSASHAEAELLGHRSPGAFINQYQHQLAAAQGQADAGSFSLIEIGASVSG
jgi:hypothetical protein